MTTTNSKREINHWFTLKTGLSSPTFPTLPAHEEIHLFRLHLHFLKVQTPRTDEHRERQTQEKARQAKTLSNSLSPGADCTEQPPPRRREGAEMPELPEVEAARKAIEDNCLGKRIKKSIVADDSKVIDGVSASDFEASLSGKTIVAAHRKGKNLWLELDSPPFPSFQFGTFLFSLPIPNPTFPFESVCMCFFYFYFFVDVCSIEI